MAVTAAKSVMAFRVLTMAVDLCRLTTRTMNVNAGHERTSKARIIHQIQLIRGITGYLFDGCVQLKTNVSTIFNLSSYSTIVTTTATFRGCSVLTGKGLVFMGKVPNVTAHYYAFYNCTSLDDFADLPGNWITNKS